MVAREMVVQGMVSLKVRVRQIARDLAVDECTVRYHVVQGVGASHGRLDRRSVVDDVQDRVTAVLRREFGFTGSYAFGASASEADLFYRLGAVGAPLGDAAWGLGAA
jgi:hypothetical protein